MHFWHAYHSQIYTTLRKLEEDGLLVSDLEDGDDKLNRRLYSITEAGRAELHTWLNAPLTTMVPVKEDLLVRLFFSGARPKEQVLDELRFQRHLHQQKLLYYQTLSADHMFGQIVGEGGDVAAIAAEIPYWVATLRFGIQFEQMYLAWLDQTIADLGAL